MKTPPQAAAGFPDQRPQGAQVETVLLPDSKREEAFGRQLRFAFRLGFAGFMRWELKKSYFFFPR